MSQNNQLNSLIDEHPPIPTDHLQKLVHRLAAVHCAAEAKGMEETPAVNIGICVLISLVREVLKYRNRYGFIELPNENWIVEEEK